MKRGRPKKEKELIGRPKMPKWLTLEQKKMWRENDKLMNFSTFGEAQTDLLIALIISKTALKNAVEILSLHGEVDGGRPHPMVSIRDRSIHQIGSLMTKLGLCLNAVKHHTIPNQKSQENNPASSFLTMEPRNRAGNE